MLSQIDRFNIYNSMNENNEFTDFEVQLKNLLEQKRDFAIESETAKGLVKFHEVEKQLENIQFKSLVPERKSSVLKQKRKFVDEPSPRKKTQIADGDYLLDKSASSDLDSISLSSGYVELQNNVKQVLMSSEEDDWIFNLNIGNVMHLQPLSSEEMNLHIDNSHELSRDAMLQKIILITVSYFCVGTELRFLNNSGDDKKVSLEADKLKQKQLSEMWHAQALESSARFLPSECPLVAHVITNYQKHHSPALTSIPEDEELDCDLRVIRPLNEVKNDNINYYQIIKNHVKI